MHKNYYMVSSIPMWNDKPLLPNTDYEIYDRDFMRGFYIMWHFIGFQVDYDGNKMKDIKLKLDDNEYQSLGVFHESSDKNYQLRVAIRKSLEKLSVSNRLLDKSSCIVKTKVSTRGVGVTGYNEGWFNSRRHHGLRVRDITPILYCKSLRYGSPGPDGNKPPEWLKHYPWSGPSHNTITADHIWTCGSGIVDVPYFLAYTFRDYLHNRNRVERELAVTLPEKLDKTAAKHFTWLCQYNMGVKDIPKEAKTLNGKYLKSFKHLEKYVRHKASWLEVKSDRLYDVDYRTLKSLGSLNVNNVVP